MHLVLVGGNSAVKIKDVVAQNYDNLEITVFSSMSEFVEMSNVRSLAVDRVILLQDGITEDKDLYSRLVSFNDYICKWFPAARFVSIVKDKTSLELMCSVFISPFMAHVCVDKMKPVMLMDLVGQPIELIKKRYATSVTLGNNSEVIEDIIGVSSSPIESTPTDVELQTGSQENTPKKKKGGLFGLFGGKADKKKKKGTPNSQQRTYTPADIDAPSGKPEETEVDEEHLVESANESSDLGGDGSGFSDILDSDVDYSVFDVDGAQGVGIGVSITQEQTHGRTSDAEEEDSSDNQPEDAPEIEEEPSAEIDESNDTESFVPVPEANKNGLDIHGDSDELDSEETTLNPGLTDRANRLAQLKDSVFSKGINLDMEGVTEVSRKNREIDLFDVDDQNPVVGDIERLSDEYDNQNTRTVEKIVEVERVVEVPVDRVVEVERIVNVGGRNKSYKNGVRTIVVTGDRKSGLTRTALNMAAHFAQTSNTLYVDFDIERKGSLLYLGLENIALEQENVQSGLAFLKSLKALQNVTYTFPKGGFDCLISVHGTEFEEGRLSEVQRILSTQRDYKTMIIDCPLENMRYLEDIVLYSEVMICVESDVPSVLNTILGLSKTSESDKFLSFLFNNGHYFLSKEDNIADFKTSMLYVRETFSLDDESLDWSVIPVIGSVANFDEVLQAF